MCDGQAAVSRDDERAVYRHDVFMHYQTEALAGRRQGSH